MYFSLLSHDNNRYICHMPNIFKTCFGMRLCNLKRVYCLETDTPLKQVRKKVHRVSVREEKKLQVYKFADNGG